MSNKLKVGDEVIVNNQVGVVMGILSMDDKTYFICTIDDMTYIRRAEEVSKTGTHHNEIENMFDSIRLNLEDSESFEEVYRNEIRETFNDDIDDERESEVRETFNGVHGGDIRSTYGHKFDNTTDEIEEQFTGFSETDKDITENYNIDEIKELGHKILDNFDYYKFHKFNDKPNKGAKKFRKKVKKYMKKLNKLDRACNKCSKLTSI